MSRTTVADRARRDDAHGASGLRVRPRCAGIVRPRPKTGDAAKPRCRRPRVPWTGSRFAGTPDPPPPFTVAPAFPKLKFEFPVVLVPAQGTSRLFLGELKGRIYSFPNDPDCPTADLALDLGKLHSDLSALYGLVVSSTIRQEPVRLRLLRPEERRAGRLGRFAVHGEPDRSPGDRSRKRAGHPHLLVGGP